MLMLALVWTPVLIFLYRAKKRGDKEMAALQFWLNTGEIYHELRGSGSVTMEKWKMLIPLFDYADRWFAKTHPYVKEFSHYGDMARNEIDDLPCQLIGSP